MSVVAVLMISCTRKNEKIRIPSLLYCLADCTFPLMISEKLFDRPWLGLVLPVISS